MKLKIENLNWDTANVFEFKYIYYLALMVYERSFKVGILTWNMSEYEPGGFFRFSQLHNIYRMVIQLGKYYYFNPNNLDDKYFKNGKNVKYFGYTVKELSEIANFDFYHNPLVPGQRLDYYNKFLKPLYLCLKEFKKIWVNAFFGSDETIMYFGENKSRSNGLSVTPTKEVNHIIQPLTGQDFLDYYTFENAKTHEVQLCCNNSREGYRTSLQGHSTFLGGVMQAHYRYFYSFGYYKTKLEGGDWVTNGHELDYARNYEGIQFDYYATIPSAHIQCPIPLQKGCSYNLYMYSCTYNFVNLNSYLNQFYSVSGAPNYRDFWEPENAPGEQAYRDLKRLPAIIQLPFGNYYETDSGTITDNFNTFNISLPTKYPFDETVYDNLPIKYLCNGISFQQYEQVDYDNSYDPTLWTPNGSTPEYSDDDDHRPLSPGRYLAYVPAQPQTSYKTCYVQCWYKPLLVVDYSSKFTYN